MKVYLSTFENDPHDSPNPFVYTLIDGICKEHDDVSFESNKKVFWTENIFDFDLIHIMWPDSFVYNETHTVDDFELQLQKIKKSKPIIVCTCHNLCSHNSKSQSVAAYDIAYKYTDVFIHLGKYSLKILKDKYPSAKHVIIPHHVYDTIYKTKYSKDEGLKKLSLPNKLYAISFGAFRNSNEKELFFKIADCLRKYHVYCIAPSFMDIPKGKINKRWIKQRLKRIYWKIKHPNVVLGGGYVSDELLPYYYAVSDISVIQRISILNSGNVPLGMFFGNVILGPNVGNINELLQETGNITFNVNDYSSLNESCKRLYETLNAGQGMKNKEYVLNTMTTQKIADDTYNLYKSLLKP